MKPDIKVSGWERENSSSRWVSCLLVTPTQKLFHSSSCWKRPSLLWYFTFPSSTGVNTVNICKPVMVIPFPLSVTSGVTSQWHNSHRPRSKGKRGEDPRNGFLSWRIQKKKLLFLLWALSLSYMMLGEAATILIWERTLPKICGWPKEKMENTWVLEDEPVLKQPCLQTSRYMSVNEFPILREISYFYFPLIFCYWQRKVF